MSTPPEQLPSYRRVEARMIGRELELTFSDEACLPVGASFTLRNGDLDHRVRIVGVEAERIYARLMGAQNQRGKVRRDAPSTSKKAALSVEPRSGTQRARVLDMIRRASASPFSPRGATDEEISDSLKMNPSSVRPRRGELLEGKFIYDSGMKRRTKSGEMAIVWVAT